MSMFPGLASADAQWVLTAEMLQHRDDTLGAERHGGEGLGQDDCGPRSESFSASQETS